MVVRRVVVVDLEATCWERAEHDPSRMETIEIGAVSVELDGSSSGALIGLRPAAYDVEIRAAGANARGAAVTGSPPLCVVRGVAASHGFPAKADPRLDPNAVRWQQKLGHDLHLRQA